jgi:hypothetical protein
MSICSEAERGERVCHAHAPSRAVARRHLYRSFFEKHKSDKKRSKTFLLIQAGPHTRIMRRGGFEPEP